MMQIETPLYTLAPDAGADSLWRCTVRATGRGVAFAPPAFEIDGRAVTARATLTAAGQPERPFDGVTEHRWAGPLAEDAGLTLTLVLRVAEDSPVVRFRYTLHSDRPVRLTKTGGGDALTYGGVSLQGRPAVTEIRSLRWLTDFPDTYSYMFMTSELIRGLSEEQAETNISFEGVFRALKILDDEARKVRASTMPPG